MTRTTHYMISKKRVISATAIMLFIGTFGISQCEALPVYADGGFTSDYKVENVQRRLNSEMNRSYKKDPNMEMVEPGHVTLFRNDTHPWIRGVLTISYVCCYILSVRATLFRHKLMFILLAGVLSYGSFLF